MAQGNWKGNRFFASLKWKRRCENLRLEYTLWVNLGKLGRSAQDPCASGSRNLDLETLKIDLDNVRKLAGEKKMLNAY